MTTFCNRIFKYRLKLDAELTKLKLPADAVILSTLVVGDELFLYAQVDPEAETVTRVFEVLATGHAIYETSRRKFIGTALELRATGEHYVWHTFELLRA